MSEVKTKVFQQKLDGKTQDTEKYFTAFSFLAEIPSLFKKELYEFFDSDIERAWRADKNDLKQFEGKVPRGYFDKKKKIDPSEVYLRVKKEGYSFITIEDDLYPPLLREIPDYPLALYYEGDLAGCNFDKALAVVGSRKASESAKCALEKIVSEFRNTDILIVSGLAYGIDATAHRAALDNGIKTVGVIASGLDIEYPSCNKELYRRIKDGGGVVISEFPPGSPPISHHFPIRNRVVTGCSKGTLVAEAALRSGAMISANLTLEQNRDLMCMPGLISNPNTQGIYKLIKDGASLVTSAQDIFEVMGWEVQTVQKEIELTELSGDEKIILDLISGEVSNIENMQAQSGLETGRLMIGLTALELKGLIKQIRSKYIISG